MMFCTDGRPSFVSRVERLPGNPNPCRRCYAELNGKPYIPDVGEENETREKEVKKNFQTIKSRD